MRRKPGLSGMDGQAGPPQFFGCRSCGSFVRLLSGRAPGALEDGGIDDAVTLAPKMDVLFFVELQIKAWRSPLAWRASTRRRSKEH